MHTSVCGMGQECTENTLLCIRDEREVPKCKYISSFLSPRREYNVQYNDQGSFQWGGGFQMPVMVLAA